MHPKRWNFMYQCSPEEIAVLRNCLLFQGLPNEVFDKIISIGKRMTAKTGEMILQENHESDMLYVVLSGSVRLSKTLEDHLSQCTIAMLQSGESLGEMRLTEDRLCILSATAEVETILFALSISELSSPENKHCLNSLLKQVIKILNSRLHGGNSNFVIQYGETQRFKRKYSLSIFALIMMFVVLIESSFIIYYLLHSNEYCNLMEEKQEAVDIINQDTSDQ